MKIKIPFEKIYTSVYYIQGKGRRFLMDGGTDEEAAKKYILPMLKDGAPDFFIVSHSHGDHLGALPYLQSVYPNASVYFFDKNLLKIFPKGKLLSDGEEIAGVRFFLTQGHSEDSLCAFVQDEGTVYSFDSLQAGGAEGYGVLVQDKKAYRETVEKIRSLKPKKLYLSHAFLPFKKDELEEEEIEGFLNECLNRVK